MTLLLTIRTTSSSETHQTEPTSTVFDKYPVVIGRSQSCDLTLTDNEKFVSSRHAIINYDNKILSVTDTSSNGVFVNGGAAALGRGNTIELTQMDTLSMGEFTLTIDITDNDSSSESASSHDPFFDSGPPASVDQTSDPFAELDDLNPTGPSKNEPDRVDRLDDLGIGAGAWETSSNIEHSSASHDPFADLITPDAAASPFDSDESSNSSDDDWAGWLGEVTPSSKNPISDTSDAGQAPVQVKPINQSVKNLPQPHNDQDTLDVLLTSAGLDPAKFATVDKVELAKHIGRILNRSTQSMMLLLRSRDEVKSAMRTELTLLAPQGNNPLKFSINVEQALESLLTPSSNNGFTDGEKAIDKGLEDIKIHQLAMLEAMRSALQIALSHFDPAVIEQQTKENNPLASNLPLAKEAKLWEQFHSRFNAIKRETVDDFSDLFGRELRKAYEKTVEELKRPG